jgi:hypothetical protein
MKSNLPPDRRDDADRAAEKVLTDFLNKICYLSNIILDLIYNGPWLSGLQR